MRRLIAFLTSMDARAWRSVVVSFVLFGGVGLVFLFGAKALGFGDAASVNQWLAAARGPWSLPLAVGAFAVLAFLGVPQFVLIAAAVVAFGPWRGLAYSWTGTMVSSLVGFWFGRMFGARLLAAVPGQGLERFLAAVAKNGLMASLVVRLVPFAPFIMVNMAAGATPIRVADFAIGTAIGIIPKIALTAFAGNSIVQVMNGGGLAPVLLLMAAIAVWLAAGWAARLWLRR